MSSALRPFVGEVGGKVLLAIAVLGAALVAALVASLAGAWGIAEVFGWAHTLNERPGPQHGEVLRHLLPRARPRRGHRPLQLEPRAPRDRRRGHERHLVAGRARLPARLGGRRPCRTSSACTGRGGVITTVLCFIVIGFGALPRAGDARLDLRPAPTAPPARRERRRRADALVACLRMPIAVSVFVLDSFEEEPPFLEDPGVHYCRIQHRKDLPGRHRGQRAPSRCSRCVPRQRQCRLRGRRAASRARCTAMRAASPSCMRAPWQARRSGRDGPSSPVRAPGSSPASPARRRIEIAAEGTHELHLDYELA